MTIGQLARQGGVGVQTVRFYERHGLLTSSARTASGYRLYPEDAARRLAFIRNAKELGFSLREIAELLSLRADPSGSCGDVRRQAEAKLREVESRIRRLERIRDTLQGLAEACSGWGGLDTCPILESLEPEELPCPKSS